MDLLDWIRQALVDVNFIILIYGQRNNVGDCLANEAHSREAQIHYYRIHDLPVSVQKSVYFR